jgi:hypothetical protein
MENPFESGHIKNYVLMYSSVVVIMLLFFIATTLFNDIQKVEKKVFPTNSADANATIVHGNNKIMKNINEVNSSMFKLMPKVY